MIEIILNPADAGEVMDVTEEWNTSPTMPWLHYWEALPYLGHTFSHWDVYVEGVFALENTWNNPISGDIRQNAIIVANFDESDYSAEHGDDTNGDGDTIGGSSLPIVLAGLGIIVIAAITKK